MKLADLSIRNPVFAVMLSAAMIVFGWLSYQRLGVSQFPEIDFPVVSIVVPREGASPEVMDGDVTDVIEDAVASVEGVDYIISQSVEGASVVNVFFRLERTIDAAVQDVQNAVAANRRRLPTDIDPPIITKVNPNDLPVMWICLFGSAPLNQITDYAENYFKQQVETAEGVGGVVFGGLRSRNVRVWIDAKKLFSFNLSAADAMDAIRRQHAELPAGYIVSRQIEFNVRTMGEAYSLADLRRLPIAERDGRQIRLEDVAVVEDGLEDRRTLARYNRLPCVAVGVRKAVGGNLVAVCDAVRERLPELEKRLPPGIQLAVPVDYSEFVRHNVAELQLTLILGVILTAVVCFLFLGSLGSTLNVCLSIPTSLIGTFFFLHFLGFTLNLMTLLALSLSVGVVVDDAILVLENIMRRREGGMTWREAAAVGTHEIGFAAIAATAAIVAIFLPMAFMTGVVGRFFFQFGVTVSIAVLLSLVCALTLTPMFCAHLLSESRSQSWFQRWIIIPLVERPMSAFMNGINAIYTRLLRWALRWKSIVVLGSVLLAGSAWGIIQFRLIGTELVPAEDQSRFVLQITCPVGSSIDSVDRSLAQCEKLLTERREVEGFLTTVAGEEGKLLSQATIFVRLVPSDHRALHQQEFAEEMRNAMQAVPGVRVVVLDLSTQGFTAQQGFPIDFTVQGNDWDETIAVAERITERMRNSGVVQDVDSDYRPGMTELHVSPNREKCASVGVSVQEVADAMAILVGGLRVAKYTDNGKRYDVRVRLVSGQRATPTDLPPLFVRSSAGKLVPLSDLCTLKVKPTLPVVNRFNHLRKVEITANPAKGVSQGEAMGICQQIAKEEVGDREGFTVVDLGNARAMQEAFDRLVFALILGIAIAYMVLGVQFNSFVHPLTVLLAVPFAMTGALYALWATGDTINMMSMIGLVLLMGLVKKNSIILVDYTQQLRESGLSLEEAVLKACPIRLRPILMTTLATIAGACPAAIGWGPGAETRAPMARAIIGGIVLSTLVTLVLVPVIYTLLDRLTYRGKGNGEDEDLSLEPSTNGTHQAGALPESVVVSPQKS